MDDRLLELSVGYHGQPIMRHMRNERPDFKMPYFISPPEEGSISDLPKYIFNTCAHIYKCFVYILII